MQGTWVQPLVRKIPHAEGQLTPWATTSEPTHWDCWRPLTYSLSSATNEAPAVSSLHTTVRDSAHTPRKAQHSRRKNKNSRDCKRTSWNQRLRLLTLFIQLRKTAVMRKGLVKTTIFSAILRPIKRNQIPRIQPPNPWRERRLGMKWGCKAAQVGTSYSQRVLFIISAYWAIRKMWVIP